MGQVQVKVAYSIFFISIYDQFKALFQFKGHQFKCTVQKFKVSKRFGVKS